MAFIEKVIDVIGPDESVPDSTLRELFSPVGEITSVTRWSSTGQKHHVFLLFKTSQMASRALSVPLKGPGRDWRMSRLNPDLKGRVMDLLPKYLQVREKAEDLAVPPPGRPPPLPPGPGSSSSGGIRALNDSWPQSLPPNPSMSQGGPLEIPLWSGHRAPGPYDTVPYGEPPPWDSSWGPPHSSGYASSGPSPYPYDIYGHENPPGASLRDLSYPLDSIGGQTSYSSGPPSIYRPPSPPPGQYAPSSGYRLPSPPPGHYAHTSPHNGSFRSLPPKPSSETIDARDGTMRYPPRASIPPETRERDPRDADRYPARKNSSPGPPRASARGQKAASRRDSRLDDKSRDWNYPPRGDRSRSRSPEGLRSPSRTLRDSRALPNGRDPRTNDFRRPRDIPRAMSPGQLSSASMEPGNSNTKAGSDDPLPTDSRAVSLALASKDAPINVWMNLVSRYRRGADLDSADQVSQAAIGYFSKKMPNTPGIAKPFLLVLAHTHNARASQQPANSAEAKTWQERASEFIRQASTLGGSGDKTPDSDASGSLTWLQKHMVNVTIPGETSSAGQVTNGTLQAGEASTSQPSAEALARFADLKSENQQVSTELRAEKAARQALEERVKSLETSLKATELKLAAAELQNRTQPNGEANDGEQLRRAEVEKTRLLSIINEERLSKRRAEDAVQEERTARRKLEDKLWQLGGSLDAGVL